MTKKTFKDLQTKAEALADDTKNDAHLFTFGEHDKVPSDRSAIEASAFHETSDQVSIHEGSTVRAVAFLMEGKYSSTGGESVNCYQTGVVNNDIHLSLVATKTEASAHAPNACESYTAEISPHYRPDEWLILSTLHKNSSGTKTAWDKIVAQELDRPLRITGHLFFDGSHVPCVNEEGRPPRLSLWEIHPVYAIDVCKHKTMAACRVDVPGDWMPLHEYMQN